MRIDHTRQPVEIVKCNDSAIKPIVLPPTKLKLSVERALALVRIQLAIASGKGLS